MAKKNTAVEKRGFDPQLISEIQPQGNISLTDERYGSFGSGGYMMCLEVYEFPSLVSDFWLTNLMNISGVIATLDVATVDNDSGQVDQQLDRSMAEIEDRISRSASDMERKHEATELELLDNLGNSIAAQGEVVKTVRVRLFIYGNTKTEVENKAAVLRKQLMAKEFQTASYLNETFYQYKSLFIPYSEQLQMLNSRSGTPMSALTLAGGEFINHEYLNDPHGMYIGTTVSGGNVIFDLFHKSKSRASYDALVIGKKGSGKSTLLKKLMKNNAIIGNYVRVIDVSGEFADLALMLGGQVITMDGKHGIINFLEVFKRDESEKVNFSVHLSKLNSLYKFLSPTADDNDRNEFEGIVRKLYEEKGLWSRRDGEQRQITGLPPNAYPTFSDLLVRIRYELYDETGSPRKELSEARRNRLESIELTIDNLVQNYGDMFDGYTSIPDISHQRVIVFDCQNINTIKSEVFNAMLWNILSLMLGDMISIGLPGKQAFESGTPVWAIPKLLLIVDEAHKIINTSNTLALDHMISIEREGRKYFTGLLFASQSVRDFAPEHSGTDAVEKIKVLFELTQYKFIMQQDPNSLDLIRNVFDGELTDGQIRDIARFQTGDAVLDITGDESLDMTIEVRDQELELFKGGA